MDESAARQARETVDAVYRTESRRVLATLIRLLGDFDVAEEAREQPVQTRAREKVFVIAFEQMPGNDAPVVEIGKQFQVWN